MKALVCFAMSLSALAPCASLGADAPLPDPRQLKQRAIESVKTSEQQLERYSCLVDEQVDELNGDGGLKRRRLKKEEQFYVNGVEIDHALAVDGTDLTGNAAKKEQARVDSEVKKYSAREEVDKARAKDEKEVDMMLRALRFSNGRREVRDGRSTVVYQLSGDPAFHPRKVEERFAQALSGRIWMDEQSGNVAELQVETDRDVKIGGGLLANVHKGFRVHLIQARQPDGVWLTRMAEGSGDLRAGLFFHPRFRFRQELSKCRLFSVDSTEAVRAPGPGADPMAK